MSFDATKGSVSYDVEATFGEDAAFVSDWILPTIGEVDVSGLTWAKIDSGRTNQYRNACTRYIPGPKGGQFTTRMYLPGRGATADGANSGLGTLLGYVFGNITRTGDADLTAGADWDTDDGTVSLADGSLADGGVLWFGALGDGEGEGQPSVVDTHAAAQLDILVALGLAPVNASAIYVAENIYPSETPNAAANTVTGLRFRLATANLQYECHGVFARAVRITGTNPNEFLTIEIDWGVSWWEEIAESIVIPTDQYEPLPNAAGSMFLQVRGTKTRALRTYRTLAINIALGIREEVGPGGANLYQSIVGVKRTPDTVTIDVTEDSVAASTSPALAALWDADASYHCLIGFTVGDNQRVAFYSPSVEFVGDRPKQMNGDGINRLSYQLRCCTGPTTTSELTLSAYRLALG